VRGVSHQPNHQRGQCTGSPPSQAWEARPPSDVTRCSHASRSLPGTYSSSSSRTPVGLMKPLPEEGRRQVRVPSRREHRALHRGWGLARTEGFAAPRREPRTHSHFRTARNVMSVPPSGAAILVAPPIEDVQSADYKTKNVSRRARAPQSVSCLKTKQPLRVRVLCVNRFLAIGAARKRGSQGGFGRWCFVGGIRGAEPVVAQLPGRKRKAGDGACRCRDGGGRGRSGDPERARMRGKCLAAARPAGLASCPRCYCPSVEGARRRYGRSPPGRPPGESPVEGEKRACRGMMFDQAG